MTAILGLLTEAFVMLVADRRITRSVRSPDGDLHPVSQDDTATKSIYLDDRYVMGFAGVATLDNMPVEKWVVDELDAALPDDCFGFLAERIGFAFERSNYTFKHCFLAVGYSKDGSPEIVRVSNYHDLSGRQVTRQYFMPFSFTVSRSRLDGNRFILDSVGSVHIPPGLRPWINKQFGRSRPPVSRCTSAMLTILRGMSEISNGTIGTACVVTSIPLMGVPMMETNITWMNYPPESALLKVHVSHSVPDAVKGADSLVYVPAIWRRRLKSGYGYCTVIGQGDDFPLRIRKQAESEEIYPFKPEQLPEGLGLFEDFPHHPRRPETT